MKHILWLSLMAGAAAHSQPPPLAFDHLAARAAEKVEVTLDSSMLQLAGRFLSDSKADEAQAKKVVAGLKGVWVRVYEFAKPGEYTPADLQPVRSHLRSPGWTRFLNAQDKDEGVEVFSKTVEGQTVGLAVIATEPKSLAVVLIDGPVDLATLAELGGKLGIPPIRISDPQKKGHK